MKSLNIMHTFKGHKKANLIAFFGQNGKEILCFL